MNRITFFTQLKKLAPPLARVLGMLMSMKKSSVADTSCTANNVLEAKCRIFPKILILTLPFLLSACVLEGVCIPDDNFTTTRIVTKAVQANSSNWIDAGIYADGENQLDISAQGDISTCGLAPTTKQLIIPSYYSGNHREWTNTGVSVIPGALLKIAVGAPVEPDFCATHPGNSKSCTSVENCSNVVDISNGGGGCKINGGNLFATISNTIPVASTAFTPYPLAGGFVELKKDNLSFTPWGTNRPGDVPNGGFSGTVNALTQAGNLYITPIDCDGCWRDNHGGYAVTITTYDSQPPPECIHKYGVSLDILIAHGDNYPTSRADGSLISAVGTYRGIPSASGKVWLRVHDNADSELDYSDNTGVYYVTIKKTSLANHNTSHLVEALVTPIQNSLNDASQLIYKSITADSHFKRIVKASLLLYIIFYALFFTLGLIKNLQIDVVIRIAKIGIILALLSDNSWDFFNTYLFSMFSEGSKSLLSAATGGSGNSNHPFIFLDTTIGQFFTDTTWQKLGALIFSGALGIVYFIVIIIAFFIYLMAVIEAIMSYLISLVAIATMIILAPFFLICILFTITRPLFDAWVGHIFNFALQPVVLFAALVLFNEFMSIAFYKVLAYRACWECILDVTIPLGSGIPSIPTPWGGTPAVDSIPIGCILGYLTPQGHNANTLWNPASYFVVVLMYLIISDATKKFVEFSPDLVAMLTGAGGGGDRLPTSTGEIMSSVKGLVVGTALAATGMDDKSINRRKEKEEIREAMEAMRKDTISSDDKDKDKGKDKGKDKDTDASAPVVE